MYSKINIQKFNIMNSNYKFSQSAMIILGFLVLSFFTGCKKFVEVPPPTSSLSGADVYTNNSTAIAVLTGIYANMSESNLFGDGYTSSISLELGLCSDELTLYSVNPGTGAEFLYTNSLSPSSPYTPNYWSQIYSTLFICNAAIEGLTASGSLTPAVKQQIMGEAKFMRALCYFYLVNLYGDVPLITGTDYNVNRLLPRAPSDSVYQQMISDLKDAQNLLSPNYLDGTLLQTTTERVRPTKWAAAALLARVYLYTGNWVSAESEADTVINNTSLYSLTSLDNVFLKNSSEAIWQLQPINVGQNTGDALAFFISADGLGSNGYGDVYLSNQQLNSFEPGDQRRADWVDSTIVNGTTNTYYYAYKYKVNTLNAPVTEYVMALRLGEQYLIRAEARAEQGNIAGSQADLNTIRNRAGLPNTTANDKESLLKAILHERQVELFTEWGQRWFDLKRTNTVDSVMSVVEPQKGGIWNSDLQLFPIPLYDLQHDPNLVQNAGY